MRSGPGPDRERVLELDPRADFGAWRSVQCDRCGPRAAELSADEVAGDGSHKQQQTQQITQNKEDKTKTINTNKKTTQTQHNKQT